MDPTDIGTTETVCYSCGGKAVPTVGPVSVRFRDEQVTVPHVSHVRCEVCGEELLTVEQAECLQRAAAEIVRERQGLLTGEIIRSWRGASGLTQEALEDVLGVGAKTVTRWERGLVFQSATADRLMRLSMRFPALLDILRSGELYTDAQPFSSYRLQQYLCLGRRDIFTDLYQPVAAQTTPAVGEKEEDVRDAIAAAA